MEDVEELAGRVAEIAAEGVRFIDLLKAFPAVHDGDLLRAVGILREGRGWT